MRNWSLRLKASFTQHPEPDSSVINVHNVATTGNELRAFINLRLILYLAGFKQCASDPNTIEHKIGGVFSEIKNMGNAGPNGGGHYTPRPLIRAIVRVLAPTIGARIHGGACGSAGFLRETFDSLPTLSITQRQANSRISLHSGGVDHGPPPPPAHHPSQLAAWPSHEGRAVLPRHQHRTAQVDVLG